MAWYHLIPIFQVSQFQAHFFLFLEPPWLIRALTLIQPHSPKRQQHAQAQPPGWPSPTQVSAPLCRHRCQAGYRVAGEPRDRGSKNQIPCLCHLYVFRLAWRSGRHRQALCELLQEQHCGVQGCYQHRDTAGSQVLVFAL